MAAAVGDSNMAANAMLGELEFSPGSHLGSSFIDSLRKKYPKACNRSLTNLSTAGLSLPADVNASRCQLTTAKGQGGDKLSAFHRGLSSSQPDLMRASGLGFSASLFGVDVDAPLGSRTASVSGLHLLLQKKSQLQTSRSSLTSAAVEQRLRESKAKMDELASKITEISRSNTSLVNVGRETNRLTLAPRSYDDDEVDDTAPVFARNNGTVVGGTVAQESIPSKKLSSSEAKAKLEEIRLKLTKKCQQLQQRREKLFTKINSSQQEKATPNSTVTSIGHVTEVVPIAPITSMDSSVAMPTTTHRKSAGTDSDGDSGIDLSMRRSKSKNSHVPKLKKFGSSMLRADNSHVAGDLTAQKRTMSGQQSEVIDEDSTETADTERDGQPISQPHEPALLPATLPASEPEIPQDLENEEHPLPKQPLTTKSVRFSCSPDVIESKTPRLLELQKLAEESAAAFEEEDFLPETSLTGFDSESSGGDSCSGDSDTDLSDVDPRLAQLALGFSKPAHQPNEKREKSPPSSSSNVESPSTNNITSNRNSHFAQGEASIAESVKRTIGPAKAPRTFASKSPGTEATSASEEGMTEDQPYSVVDISAFSSKEAKKKGDGIVKDVSECKPPLPKSKPPKSASSRTNTAGDDMREGGGTRSANDMSSRRSQLDKRDFELPYSHSNVRPQSSSHNGVNDCHASGAAPDDTSCSPVSSCTSDLPAMSTAPTQFSKPLKDSTRGNPGSCNDLWGSNASLYSSNEKLGSNSSLSGSRSSLFERVGSFRQAAKKKMKSLKRSLSLDRLSGSTKSRGSDLPPSKPLSKKATKAEGVPTIKPSLSWKSLNHLKLSKKGSYTTKCGDAGAGRLKDSPTKPVVSAAAERVGVDEPNHFRRIGKLLELCADGCKRVQLNRPPHGPFGFYIGPSEHRPGVFITRLSDSYAGKLFAGLLAVGDEIKEVNGVHVSKLSQEDILDMISKGRKVILKVKSSNTVTSELWF